MEGEEIGLSGDGGEHLRNIQVGLHGEEGDEERVEIKEEMIEELMQWLESEIDSPMMSDHRRGTPFVTINGNEETCGPSSDTVHRDGQHRHQPDFWFSFSYLSPGAHPT